MSTTKTILLGEFEKGMYLHWNFCKQTSNGLSIKLYDDTKVYAEKHGAANNGALISFGDDGAEMKGNSGSLKCDVIYDRSGVGLKYWMQGRVFNDQNHNGAKVAYVNVINGEDSTDNDYNDFHVTVTGWVPN